jgi:hypothetical protein
VTSSRRPGPILRLPLTTLAWAPRPRTGPSSSRSRGKMVVWRNCRVVSRYRCRADREGRGGPRAGRGPPPRVGSSLGSWGHSGGPHLAAHLAAHLKNVMN